jgi:uncharacterized protein YndB with AHSA1/START domain
MYGTYETIDGRPVLHFERRLAHQVDAVWQAVTEPDELAHWFPTAVTVDDLRVGGQMSFTFPDDKMPPMEGEVTELTPPRLFAFSWGEDQLRFELEPADDGKACLLRLTCVLGQENKASRDAAGWHVCLDGLERHLGTPTRRPHPEGQWREHYAEYERRGLPTGAPVPD